MKKTLFLFALIVLATIKIFAQNEPKLMLPIGHTFYVVSVQFSPDGKKVVTGSWDKTARIWDAKNGILLHTLEGHTDWVGLAVFSHDGSRIITASNDHLAKIWDASSGKLLHTLKGHTDWVNSIDFSPDDSLIVTTSSDHTARIWDASSGKLLRILEGHVWIVSSGVFSLNGNCIVTASRDKTAMIWNTSNGMLLHTLKGHTSDVNNAIFSPDGSLIVTASKDSTAKIWDATNGKLLHTLEGHTSEVNNAIFSPDGNLIVTASKDSTARIWDANSGILLRTLEGHTDWVGSAIFSPDGNRIVTASCDKTARIWDASSGGLLYVMEGIASSAVYSSDGSQIVTSGWNDKTARIWDASSGKLLHTLEGHTDDVESVIFSPDGRWILTSGKYDKTPKIWDIFNGKPLLKLEGHNGFVQSTVYSIDGSRIVTASWDNTARIWDAATGRLLHTLEGHYSWINSAVFSPNGSQIVTASLDNTAIIWDAESGTLLHTLKGHNSSVITAQFSLDGKRIVTTSEDNTAKIWDAETGKLLHTLKGHTSSVITAQFSPDDRKIVTASDDYTAKVWDATSGKLLHTLEGHTFVISSAIFSTNCSRILTASYDGTAKIWDASTGKLLHNLEGHNDFIISALYSPDSNLIVTISGDNTARIWNALNGKLLHILEGHVSTVLSAVFSPDGKYILTTGDDDKTIVWDVATSKILYTRLQLINNDWLVYDQDYHYDGTEGARDYLYFVCGNEIIDLAQMKDALYVPGLAEKIMTGQKINYEKLSNLPICGTLPLVERVESDTSCYHYRITPRKLGVEFVEVYVNGKMVYNFPINELKVDSGVYILKLLHEQVRLHFIPGQENSVKVVAVAKLEGSLLRSRGTVINEQDEAKTFVVPRMFAVIVGVNDYKEGILDLNYPAKDAADFGSALELSAKKLLGDSNVFTYMIQSNVKPGSGYTTPEKEGIRKAMEDIGKKARTQDIVLIFFAGHGVMQGSENKKFTFLTADASGVSQIGISTKELQQWLSFEGPFKMKANKTILIFDACNSGQASKELAALVRSDDETRRIRQVEDLRDKSGVFILAASASEQSAYELPQYEQGLLTYSLLSVLKNNPDILEEGRYLNVQKWFLESEKYLKQLVSSLGLKQDAQPFGTANIRIGEVDEEVKNSIHLADEKPVVVCANVINDETLDDNLNLKGLINEKLLEISERGIDQKIIYAGKETESANKINIRYTIKGQTILCEIRLLKSGETLHGASATGNKSNLDDLVIKIIDEVVKYAK